MNVNVWTWLQLLQMYSMRVWKRYDMLGMHQINGVSSIHPIDCIWYMTIFGRSEKLHDALKGVHLVRYWIWAHGYVSDHLKTVSTVWSVFPDLSMQSIKGGPSHTYNRPHNASDKDLRRTTNMDAVDQELLVECLECKGMDMISTTPDVFYEIMGKILTISFVRINHMKFMTYPI